MGQPRLNLILIALSETPRYLAHWLRVISFPRKRITFPFGLTDSDKACSIFQPALSLALNVPGRMWFSSASSTSSLFFFRKKINRLFDLFRACCLYVAQTQLVLEYGPSLFFLSNVCRADGRGPMSSKNAKKEFFHFGATKIPLFPYRRYCASFGLWHLDFIPFHMRYSDRPGTNERGINGFSQLAIRYMEQSNGARR